MVFRQFTKSLSKLPSLVTYIRDIHVIEYREDYLALLCAAFHHPAEFGEAPFTTRIIFGDDGDSDLTILDGPGKPWPYLLAEKIAVVLEHGEFSSYQPLIKVIGEAPASVFPSETQEHVGIPTNSFCAAVCIGYSGLPMQLPTPDIPVSAAIEDCNCCRPLATKEGKRKRSSTEREREGGRERWKCINFILAYGNIILAYVERR